MKHARLLPDVCRLLYRLARDKSLPRHVRVRVWLLGLYLISPLDLIPDLIPVIGVMDEILVIGWTVRSVVKRAGREVVESHWPGTDDGLGLLYSLARIKEEPRMSDDGICPETCAAWTIHGDCEHIVCPQCERSDDCECEIGLNA